MTILIIEDEKIIAKRLVQLLDQINVKYTLCDILGSVKESIDWLKSNEQPDLIFADIQLSDGNSFSIFKEVEVTSQIIFTTSYDEFALDAFQVNSIDYLLKPITAKKLKSAFDKLELMRKSFQGDEEPVTPDSKKISDLLNYIETGEKVYKNRFLVKAGSSLKSITAEEIAYFYVSNKSTYMMTYEKRRFPVDLTLDQIERSVDVKVFFRINRQMIINIKSVKEIRTFFNSRLLLTVEPKFDDDVLVTRSNIQRFKVWMNS